MGAEQYDLVILGCGPAGEKAAAQAAYFGKRVAVIEKEPEPGGAAVHTGTLPSKTLRETALYLSGFRARDLYGISVSLDDPRMAVPSLIARKEEIEAAESRRMRENLRKHGVDLLSGWGRIAGANTVRVDGEHSRTLQTAFILVATGSSPYRPQDIAFDDPLISCSDDILLLNQMPRTMTILGAGVIGLEYACMFGALGVKVTVVDRRDRVLPFLDHEIVDRLTDAMSGALGVSFRMGVGWGDVRRTSDTEIACSLGDGEVLVAEKLLFTAGRGGNTRDIGLDTIGLQADRRGYIPVDGDFRTAVPSVFAAGDVVGFPALASVSMEQGRVAACRMFGFAYKDKVAPVFPYGIYTIPEVSAIGENEQTAADKGIDYVTGSALYVNNPRGQITGDLEGMTKLVVCRQTRKVLGVHVIGERASELVHIGQAVMHFGGCVDAFIEMVFNYPTLADSFKYAAYDALGKLNS